MIYVVSTYPPKACGIAVFSQNFTKSLEKRLAKKSSPKSSKSGSKPSPEKNPEDLGVIAMVDERDGIEKYDREVIYKINKNDQKEYSQAADFVNINKPRICVIEHEFGIFGGENGYFIFSFLNRIEVTNVVVVLHTIPQTPNKDQRFIIQKLSKCCHRLVVMSRFGMDYLQKIYGVPLEKISYIPHGVPHFKSTVGRPSLELKKKELKKKFPGRLLVTFGLLSRNKGLETAILAMRKIIQDFPDTRYLIIGKTHPEVVKHNGEEYRNYLNRLVEENQLQEHVLFINSFLSEEQIIEYVMSADLYVTPYQDPNQITSGTLSYAIGSGIPFVSTPYRYAEEKAQYGCGRLFPFHGDQEMAEVVGKIFKNPTELKKMRDKCLEVKKSMSWDNVAKEYLSLFRTLDTESKTKSLDAKTKKHKINLSWMPKLNLAHVYRLTDSTGIIQHAHFTIPRFSDGYCVDDNARALLLMTMAYRINSDPLCSENLSIYIAFLNHMINEDGSVRNFLSFDRRYLDEVGSDDAYGRSLWALGYLLIYPPSGHFREIGEELFSRMRRYLPRFSQQGAMRGIASAIMGISYYLIDFPDDEEMKGYLRVMADRLLQSYKDNHNDDWGWFEKKMSYDNALMPLALIRAYEFLGDENYLEVGLKTTNFLDTSMLMGGHYRPIGNSEWYHHKHDSPSDYDQQPIEIMSLCWLNYHTFRVTKEAVYLNNIQKAFRWFLGDNTVGIPLYDYETKGCRDGLQENSVNRNQGAESTLAFWISYCLVSLGVELESGYLQSTDDVS